MPTSARRAIAFLLVARAGGVVGAAIALVVPGPVIPLQDAAFPGVPLEAVAVAERSQPSPHIEVAPADGGADTLLVLYPGAFLRPHAYTWIGVALAPHGVRTLIPTMPLDLAILAQGRAGALVKAHPDVERVLVGGHSLGGAMAARWARGHPRHADALVLLGAYSAGGDDLSDADLAVLVLAAEWDGLASLGEIRAGMERLPADSEIQVLPGAVHGFFGRYGPQRLDGFPTVSRGEAEQQIIDHLISFVERVRSP